MQRGRIVLRAIVLLLTCAAGDLEISVDAKAPAKTSPAPRPGRETRPKSMVEVSAAVKRGIDITKRRSIKQVKAEQMGAAGAAQ